MKAAGSNLRLHNNTLAGVKVPMTMMTKCVRWIRRRIRAWATRPRVIGVHWWGWNVLCRAFILWLNGLLLWILFGFLCRSALASACLGFLLSHAVDTCAWVDVVVDGPIRSFATIS